MQRGEQRHAVAQQGAQRAGEQGQLVLVEQRADHRQAQRAPLPPGTPGRRAQPAPGQPAQQQRGDGQQQAVLAKALPQRHDDARGQRQRLAHVLEQALELRHHEAQHADQRQQRDAQQDGRVQGGGDDAFAQRAQPLHVRHQAFEHLRHLAAGFARAHHVEVEVAKQLAPLGQRATEGGAALDVFEHAFQQLAHAGLGAHLDQHAQRVVQRQAGAQHDGQLAGEGQHVGALHRALERALAGAAQRGRGRGLRRGGADVDGRQAALAQLAQHDVDSRGFAAAFDQLAVGGGGAPDKFSHCGRPRVGTGSREVLTFRSGPASRAAARRGW